MANTLRPDHEPCDREIAYLRAELARVRAEHKVKCLCRAFGDEPKALNALQRINADTKRIRRRAVEVYGDNPHQSLGFPEADVFAFDELLFERLKAAHAAGDREQLLALWGTAQPFRFAGEPTARAALGTEPT